MKRIAILLFIVLSTPAAHADDSAKGIQLFTEAMIAYERISDYICTFHKKELVDGELIESKSDLKFKKPFSVFYKESLGPNKDIACVYIKGKNDNKLATRNTGLLGLMTVNLDPQGSIAMKGNRHPITHVGIGYILTSASKDISNAKKNGDAIFTYEGLKDIFGNKAHLVTTTYPENKGYYAHIVQLYYDVKTGLPLKITMFDWKKQLIEEYAYENLKANISLTDKDFII